MINMDNYYNPFIIKTVFENGEYVPGIYVNRVPIHGFYIEAKKDTLMFDLEIKAKAKFKLERDPENYCQEVRMHYFRILYKYIDKFGEPNNESDELHMRNYIAKGCLNELKNLAKKMKSNTSYYDDEKGEFVIQKIISIGGEDKNNEISLETLEYEIFNRNESNVNCYSDFAIWFNREKHNILTKRQLNFLDNPSIVDNTNRKKIEKNIRKRIDIKYSNISINDCRIYELDRKLNVLDNILNKNRNIDILKNIAKVIDNEEWLIEELYSIDLDTCKLITDAINGFYYNDVINTRKICHKLIKKEEEIKKLLKNM